MSVNLIYHLLSIDHLSTYVSSVCHLSIYHLSIDHLSNRSNLSLRRDLIALILYFLLSSLHSEHAIILFWSPVIKLLPKRLCLKWIRVNPVLEKPIDFKPKVVPDSHFGIGAKGVRAPVSWLSRGLADLSCEGQCDSAHCFLFPPSGSSHKRSWLSQQRLVFTQCYSRVDKRNKI